jgi:hypothetical protein
MAQETAYPLSWPNGWPRAKSRYRAKFGRRLDRGSLEKLTVAQALTRLQDEVARLGAHNSIISTDLQLRLDGLPRSSQAEPRDPGAALYFTFRRQKTALACDKWDRVADNLAALAGHICALRAIERYGVGTLEQAFRGYQQLEDFTAGVPWRRVLGFKDGEPVTLEQIESGYRHLAKEHHPDRGGSHEQMAQLTQAIAAARKELVSAE